MRFTEREAECLVFTFKEGMLSPIAHDLKVRVTRFEIEIEGLEEGAPRAVRASFDASSLRVECAMKDGSERPDALSEGDRRKIEQTIAADVLHPDRHPKVSFASSRVDGDRVEGKLALHGVERPLQVEARREGGRYVVEVELNQTDFGIKPYTAALGTLRIKPVVRVRVAAPMQAAAAS